MVWFIWQTAHYTSTRCSKRLADGMIGESTTRTSLLTPRAGSAAVHGDPGRIGSPAVHASCRRRPPRRADGAGLPDDRFMLLFVGQIKRPKGVLDIVDSLCLLRRELPNDRMPLLLVIGTPDPPDLLDEIARRCCGRVASDIRVLPQQQHVERWMQATDLLISGSHQDTEGMSRVLHEAMACGAVPIATNIGETARPDARDRQSSCRSARRRSWPAPWSSLPAIRASRPHARSGHAARARPVRRQNRTRVT